MEYLLLTLYVAITGIANVSTLGRPRDPASMTLLLFASGFVVVPALLLRRLIRGQ